MASTIVQNIANVCGLEMIVGDGLPYCIDHGAMLFCLLFRLSTLYVHVSFRTIGVSVHLVAHAHLFVFRLFLFMRKFASFFPFDTDH